MVQCLSLPLVVIGIVLLVVAHKLNRPQVGRLEGHESPDSPDPAGA